MKYDRLAKEGDNSYFCNAMEQDVTKFFKLYSLVGSTQDYATLIDGAKCRICGKSHYETTFNKEAHLLSRFLDSHHLVNDECDSCNELFSKWENDFAHFIRPYLTIHGISPGKSKIPLFQSRTENKNEETRSVFDFNDGNRKFIIQEKDDYTIIEDKKQVKFVFRKPKFNPLHIYKVLLKTAIELFPPQLLFENRFMCDWLLGKHEIAHIFPYVFRTTIPSKRFAKPQAWLYRANDVMVEGVLYPEYVLIFAVTNLVFQLTLPFSFDFMKLEQEGLNKCIEYFPAFIFEELTPGTEQTVVIRYYNMSVDKKVTEDEIITFDYDNIDKQITKH